MKKSIQLSCVILVAALFGGAFLWSTSPEDVPAVDPRAFFLVRTLSLEHGIDASILANHFMQNPSDTDVFYKLLLAGRLCRLYENFNFPAGAWKSACQDTFGNDNPDAEAMADVLSEYKASLGVTAREILKGKPHDDAFWTAFRDAMQGFYLKRGAEWQGILAKLVDTIKVQIVGVVENRILHQPVSGATVTMQDKSQNSWAEVRTDSKGFFTAVIPFRMHYQKIGMGVVPNGMTIEDLFIARGTLRYNRPSSSHFAMLQPVLPSGQVSVTVIDRDSRLPLAGAKVSVIQDELAVKTAPVVSGVFANEQAEETFYGGAQTIETDQFGNAQLEGQAGFATVQVEFPGYPLKTFSVGFIAFTARSAWLDLSKNDAPVKFEVKDDRGNPVPYARITQAGMGSMISDAGGVFKTALPRKEEGKFQVELRGTFPVAVEVKNGEPANQTVTLEMYKPKVFGRVRDFRGNPIAGAMALSPTTGDIQSSDSTGHFSVSLYPEPDAAVLLGKEGYLNQVVSPNLTNAWIRRHSVVYGGDVVLAEEKEAAPWFETPSEGAFMDPDSANFDIRFPAVAQRAWGACKLSMDGQSVDLAYDAQLRHRWKFPLSEGEHEAVFESDLTDSESGAVRVIRTTRKFVVGRPSFLKSATLSPGGNAGQVLTAEFNRESLTPQVRDTLRLFVNSRLTTYAWSEKDGDIRLQADVPSLVLRVRLTARDEQGRDIEYFR